MSPRQLWWRFVWWPFIRHRYVSVARFRQEQRSYLAAETRGIKLREWIEDKRHHETDRPNYARISHEAWAYAMRVYPD